MPGRRRLFREEADAPRRRFEARLGRDVVHDPETVPPPAEVRDVMLARRIAERDRQIESHLSEVAVQIERIERDGGLESIALLRRTHFDLDILQRLDPV